jgi:hypothetical protein
MCRKKNSFLFIELCLAILLGACAGQIPPPGGPVDTTPPQIVRTEPDSNAVNVQTNAIVLEFSEYVERRSVEESIFISPYVGELEFDWSGREVTIAFPETLRSNTTYVMNVGTDVVDLRARNRMAHGFTLAFSTGDSIDKGAINGKVFDEKPEGVMLFAYALGGRRPDTLDPATTKPDYIMQTGKDGSFTFAHIRFDTYRVIAVRDVYRNLLYDRQIDQFGVTTRDVTINERKPQAGGLWFRLSEEDTTKPFLARVTALTDRQLQLRFSEPLDSTGLKNARVTIQDTLSREMVGIQLQSLVHPDSVLANVLTATPLDSSATYRLTVEHVFDKAGNGIDTANASYIFAGVGTPDTVIPSAEFVDLPDSTKEVPLDASFLVRFSEPVQRDPLTSAITLLDSVRNAAPISFRWLSASSLSLVPTRSLQTRTWYTFTIVLDSVRDFAGNHLRDSLRMVRFQTLDLKTTGSIEGTVADADTTSSLGEIFLTATKVASAPRVQRTVRLPRPGKFSMSALPEGRYTLDAFRDRDSSRTYSSGRPFPFQPSERFTVSPDTVKVRARWAVEGVRILFGDDAR